MSELEDAEVKPPIVDDDSDDAAALIAEVQTNEKGDKYVGLSTHIGLRKEAKAQKREIAELRAKVAENEGLQQRVDELLPIAEAVRKDERLAADIRATLEGKTRPTRVVEEKPVADAEGQAFAETNGWLTAEGEVDAARGRRALDLYAGAVEKRLKPQIDAANDAAFGMRGEQNLAALYRMETPSGELIATDESIKEILKDSQMPMRMLADPKVARTVGLMAAGLDREKGRTPKAPAEPMYLERASGRRGEAAQISDADRRMAARVGVSEAQLTATSKLKPNRRGEIDLETV